LGVCFENPVGGLREAIESYFEAEIEGMKVTEVHSKQEEGVIRSLFRGENSCELFYWQRDEEVLGFTIMFFGNLVEAEGDKIISIGSQARPSDKDLKGFKVFKTVKDPGSILNGSIRFIESIPSLNATHRAKIIRTLETHK
jgi:hypothetical protein